MSYIAFFNDRTWKLCDSLYEALTWIDDIGGPGGRVYEPIGSDIVRKLFKEEQEMERLRRENLELKAAWRSGENPDDYPHLFEEENHA